MPSKYRRKSQTRAPFKRIVIAMEGEKTEPEYFTEVKKKYQSAALSIIPLERARGDGRSAPKHVLSHLDSYVTDNNILNSDECWIIIDKDRWPDAQLKLVAAHCSKHKNYHLALSNPCFEIWLVLHYKNLSGLSALEKKTLGGRKQIKSKWAHLKSQLKINSNSRIVEQIADAIANARKLDTSPELRWPHSMGTHVYRLAEAVIKNAGLAS
jgi:hypothetical protein